MIPKTPPLGSQDILSVDQVASLLGLHVKTVRAYVREGRLKAVRIGKQYRIARADLEALTGRPLVEPEPVRRTRHVEVSSIVEVDAISPEAAGRLTNGLIGAVNGRGGADRPPLRVDCQYDEERGRLKIILTGGLATCASLLQLIGHYLEAPR